MVKSAGKQTKVQCTFSLAKREIIYFLAGILDNVMLQKYKCEDKGDICVLLTAISPTTECYSNPSGISQKEINYERKTNILT